MLTATRHYMVALVEERLALMQPDLFKAARYLDPMLTPGERVHMGSDALDRTVLFVF